MAPLADAMRLVHRDQPGARAAQEVQRRPGSKSFGRDVEQFQPVITSYSIHYTKLYDYIVAKNRGEPYYNVNILRNKLNL